MVEMVFRLSVGRGFLGVNPTIGQGERETSEASNGMGWKG